MAPEAEARARNTETPESTSAPEAMPASIKLRHIQYFLAVFEELHFGRAAERLHIARPALSEAIRKLEDTLGVQLFARTSRFVSPTPAGMTLAKESRNVLSAFERALTETQRAGGATGALRIGCVPDLSVNRLLRFLTAVHHANPSMEAQVANLPGLEQVRRLRRGELDLGIVYEGTPVDGLEVEPLFPGEQMVLFLKREHPLTGKRVITPPDLRQETLMVGPRVINPAVFDRWMTEASELGYEWSALTEAGGNTVRDLFLAMADSDAVALSKPSAQEDPTAQALELEARPLDPPLRLPPTNLAWLVDSTRPLAGVIEAARKIGRELRRPEEAKSIA